MTDQALVAKVTKFVIRATLAVERDGVTVAEADAPVFTVFAGQPVDLAAVVGSLEAAANSKPDELAALVEQCRPK